MQGKLLICLYLHFIDLQLFEYQNAWNDMETKKVFV